jgi:hypothetical protein
VGGRQFGHGVDKSAAVLFGISSVSARSVAVGGFPVAEKKRGNQACTDPSQLWGGAAGTILLLERLHYTFQLAQDRDMEISVLMIG